MNKAYETYCMIKQAAVHVDKGGLAHADSFGEILKDRTVNSWKNGSIPSILIGAGLGGGLGYLLNNKDTTKGRFLAALAGAGIGGLGGLGINHVRDSYEQAKWEERLEDMYNKEQLGIN